MAVVTVQLPGPASQPREVAMTGPVPKRPIRPGDACSLCQPGVAGPEDCGLVWLVMDDPDLRARLAELRREAHLAARGG
jgi:hypothetical protein